MLKINVQRTRYLLTIVYIVRIHIILNIINTQSLFMYIIYHKRDVYLSYSSDLFKDHM